MPSPYRALASSSGAQGQGRTHPPDSTQESMDAELAKRVAAWEATIAEMGKHPYAAPLPPAALHPYPSPYPGPAPTSASTSTSRILINPDARIAELEARLQKETADLEASLAELGVLPGGNPYPLSSGAQGRLSPDSKKRVDAEMKKRSAELQATIAEIKALEGEGEREMVVDGDPYALRPGGVHVDPYAYEYATRLPDRDPETVRVDAMLARYYAEHGDGYGTGGSGSGSGHAGPSGSGNGSRIGIGSGARPAPSSSDLYASLYQRPADPESVRVDALLARYDAEHGTSSFGNSGRSGKGMGGASGVEIAVPNMSPNPYRDPELDAQSKRIEAILSNSEAEFEAELQRRYNPAPWNSKPTATHFLVLPLNNHPALGTKTSLFQNALFGVESDANIYAATEEEGAKHGYRPYPRFNPTPSPLVQGLDTTVIVDPRRMHITLGAMTLYPDLEPVPESHSQTQSTTEGAGARPPRAFFTTMNPSFSVQLTEEQKKSIKTVKTALALLASLKPRISEILDGSKGVNVPLEVMSVMRPERIPGRPGAVQRELKGKGKERAAGGLWKMSVGAGMRAGEEDEDGEVNVGASVLFVAPKKVAKEVENEDRRKLREVTDLIYQTFKQEGYFIEKSPPRASFP
ncbi:hypothetical protein GALMADRAFT_409741 [Galerina marginata CBS 339.88]|uniref:Uncharacterized protein n=1 Tax=Galerina marginata (strain CBS 339.88) TaxID=685588 RepID=A0A067T5L2_GALM3|nr:hypothetical protein GALMADRAFT_409741 [Galerina marginata CBS 339.88]